MKQIEHARARTLIEVLRWRAAHEGQDRAYTFLLDGESREAHMSWGELDLRARTLAAFLQDRKMVGERVLLLYPSGLDFTAAFMGCLYAGSLPVTAFPPDQARVVSGLRRLGSMVEDCRPALALSTAEMADALAEGFAELPQFQKLPLFDTDDLDPGLSDSWHDPGVGPDDLAFLQYTSGSTSTPKGVMVSHGNLVQNSKMLSAAFGTTESSIIVSWLPLFHDMGLIGHNLHALWNGAWCIFMSPLHFLQKPIRWLEAISKHRATMTGAPNFAYELCLRRTTAEERSRLDLASLDCAFNGAEPVRPETVERFCEDFAECGFRREAHYPCYGLAEVTLMASGCRLDIPPRLHALSAAELKRGRAVAADPEDEDAQVVVSCGRSPLGEEIAVVDPESRVELPPGEVGEIWLKGPSVAQGYWERPKETRETFKARLADGRGPFLRTGDLGFLIGEELCIATRQKDVIIVRGQNHYPQDIEFTVGACHAVLSPGRTAAVAVEVDGMERLVVIFETRPGKEASFDFEDLVKTVRRTITERHDLKLYALVQIPAQRLPKTTSGKIQRQACRRAFLEDRFKILAEWRDPLLSGERGGAAVGALGLEELLRALVAARAGIEAQAIDGRLSFDELGLDSADAVGMTGELEKHLGKRLSPTLFYEHPSLEKLLAHLEPDRRPSTAAATVPVRERGREREEAIAIVGLGCRFPGAPDKEAYWRLLTRGVDAVSEVPASRFNVDELYDPDPEARGKIVTRWGGFLDDVELFDAAFFGISPREAERVDPQQRLLLEVAWEALEDAGLPAEEIAGSRTGVFVGISGFEYAHRQLADPRRINAYAGTGSALSIAANRLSYFFDLHGPSLAIDTACSSSLVAIHYACESLRRGESSLALAGGVNLILAPGITVNFSRAGVMAPDGRCKTFDARANGYVRSEGVGLVVLKPLSQALCDGDPVYATIRGGAVNQDGRSNGLLAPNREAQAAVLREAYAASDVRPSAVQYVEAHGTGTFLGDPIEARALGSVLSRGRSDGRACRVGSVKTNIGHAEAAAGVAGLIKVALALRHGLLPPHLHFESPNPHIDFKKLGLEVQRELEAWPESDAPRLAGVSSFGFGGANAHLVLEEAPARTVEPEPETAAPVERAELLVLSARAPEALRDRATRARDRLAAWQEEGATLGDLCHTAAVRCSQLDHRLAVVGRDWDEIGQGLDAFLADEARPGVAVSRSPSSSERRIVFVFPGQGGQWRGMGQGLMAGEPVFRRAVERVARAMDDELGFRLDEALAEGRDEWLESIDRIQPALFALQIALAELWRSWGVEPVAVIGHSLGEVAAAHVAGALSLADAVRVICRRSRLLRRISGQGAMAVVGLPLDEARRAIAGDAEKVSVAVSNSPGSTVLAGDRKTLEEIFGELEKRDVFCRWVQVDVASHSPQVEPLDADLRRELAGLLPRGPVLRCYSTVTGRALDPGAESAVFSTDYWLQNLRQPVLFAAAVEAALADGADAFLELGPHPVLISAMQELAVTAWPSLRREEDERSVMLGSLGELFAAGHRLAGARLYPTGRRLALPPYPWRRERFWLADETAPTAYVAAGAHPLLGLAVRPAQGRGVVLWQAEIAAQQPAYLDHHRLQGEVVMPGAALLEMAASAAADHFCSSGSEGWSPVLEELSFQRPLRLDGQGRRVQTVLEPRGDASAAVRIYSQDAESAAGADWTLHLTCRARASEPASGGRAPAEETAGAEISVEGFYHRLQEHGLGYGAAFRAVRRLRASGAVARAEIYLGEELDPAPYLLHPVLVDAAWQSAATVLPESAGAAVPAGLECAVFHLDPEREPDSLRSRVEWRGGSAVDGWLLDVELFGEGGRVAEMRGLRLRSLSGAGSDAENVRDWLYEVDWRQAPRPDAAEPTDGGPWLIFCDRQGVGEELAEKLVAAGATVSTVVAGDPLRRCEEGAGESAWELDPQNRDDYRRLIGELGAEHPRAEWRIVHLWSLDVPPATEEGDGLEDVVDGDRGWLSVLWLLQASSTAGLAARWYLVSAGVQSLGEPREPLALFQAPLWGLARTLAHEHPELRPKLVDLSSPADPGEARFLLAELLDDTESQVALRGADRFVARLVPGGGRRRFEDAGESREAAICGRDAFRLEIDQPGLLDTLKLRAHERRAPSRGEVEIAVRAAGLNFMDVFKAHGFETGGTASPRLGGECSGVVVAVGEGVEEFSPDDEVVALAPHSFSSFVTADVRLVAAKPPQLSFADAAALPIARLTARFALVELARLQRGEKVLIHAATGGVGLAAIELAQRLGAEIFATAGSPKKRQYLREIGIRHVASSREPGFSGLCRAAGGVDVVLNSLAGELAAESLECLAPYGRFVEIGKRDIYERRDLELWPFRKNLSFFALDLEGMVTERPARLGALLREIMASDAPGESPGPRRYFPIAEAPAALRYMARARHVGKIVLELPPETPVEVARARRAATIRSDRSYLITGGLGGLGLELAEWMAGQGAGQLILLGRSAPATSARARLEGWRRGGTPVRVARADVADRAALRTALAEALADAPPLAGVIHAAGTLDDGILLELDRQRFASVLAPKVAGAWNLHQATLTAELDFFVLFSSAAGVLGSPGQGNYAAANAFLDALAAERRRRGLVATSLAWGPWSEVGLAARPERGGVLALRGLRSFSPLEGMAVMADQLAADPRAVPSLQVIAAMDWAQMGRHFTGFEESAFFQQVVGITPDEEDADRAGELTASGLLALGEAARRQALEDFVSRQLAQILGLGTAKIDSGLPILRLGLDSLMAVELRNRLEKTLAVAPTVVELLEGPSVTELVERLIESLEGMPAAGTPDVDSEPAEARDEWETLKL